MSRDYHYRETAEKTGRLFGELWSPFDDAEFEASVQLFKKRFTANRFDMQWFNGKTCVDVGCGGGRYCIGMAREGAQKVVGVDAGKEGIEDARRRSVDYPQVEFQVANVLDLPFEDGTFDFVFCSGVIHHLADQVRGFREVCRIAKPGGKIFLLLYATGGVRWPAVMEFRGALESVPAEVLKRVMTDNDFPAPKIRTIQDDLKVPVIEFYHWERLKRILNDLGVENLQRWEKGRLDHEESLSAMRADMAWFDHCFLLGVRNRRYTAQFEKAHEISQSYLRMMDNIITGADKEAVSRTDAERVVIGQGHHRVIGEKVS